MTVRRPFPIKDGDTEYRSTFSFRIPTTLSTASATNPHVGATEAPTYRNIDRIHRAFHDGIQRPTASTVRVLRFLVFRNIAEEHSVLLRARPWQWLRPRRRKSSRPSSQTVLPRAVRCGDPASTGTGAVPRTIGKPGVLVEPLGAPAVGPADPAPNRRRAAGFR
jgi:hypothetical protein